MIVYQTKIFERWAKKAGVGANDLCKEVLEMKRGLYEADLGGNLLKKRIARPGQGKRGGFRTLIATNRGNKWFFLFGWPKNERSNIDGREETAFKRLGAVLLGMPTDAVRKAEQNGELIKVNCHE